MSTVSAGTMALGLVRENNSDLSSDRLNSMNHKTDKTIRTSFWIEKLTKKHPTTIKMNSNKHNFLGTMALGLVCEKNSDLSSDRLNSMNHKTDKTIKTSFWIEKLTKKPPTTIKMISNKHNFCRNYGIRIGL